MGEQRDALHQELLELRARVEELAGVLSRLSGGVASSPPDIAAAAGHPADQAESKAQVDALVAAQLRRQLDDPSTVAAAYFAAVLRSGTGQQYSWATSTTVRGTFGLEEARDIARVLSALGSDARLRIMAILWRGETAAAELTAATGLSAGSLYHHIRELCAFGWVNTPQRNRYTLTTRGRRALVTAWALAGVLRPEH
jgi:DNA-binding HxlR family transcriptional regulator